MLAKMVLEEPSATAGSAGIAGTLGDRLGVQRHGECAPRAPRLLGMLAMHLPDQVSQIIRFSVTDRLWRIATRLSTGCWGVKVRIPLILRLAILTPSQGLIVAGKPNHVRTPYA
jgi:hypothetical protein